MQTTTKTMTPVRRATLDAAIALGADEATMAILTAAGRVGRKASVVLPAHHLEGKSRGTGQCRGKEDGAPVWGERVENGYRVGPGRWTVVGHDGFSRTGEDVWTVRHVAVGTEIWTVADAR